MNDLFKRLFYKKSTKLAVVFKGTIVAYISLNAESNTYVLEYTKDFLNFNLSAFNYKDIPFGATPEIGKKYESKELWAFFSTLIPSTDRKDIKEVNYKKPLEALASLKNPSISNSFEFENKLAF